MTPPMVRKSYRSALLDLEPNLSWTLASTRENWSCLVPGVLTGPGASSMRDTLSCLVPGV